MTRYKLLLIDGQAARAAALLEQLQLLGYGVLLATDGVEGHALASRGECDLILLDLEIAGRDGQLICKSLRVRHQTTPVLALATDLSDEAVQAALVAGADAAVQHPCRPTVLSAWIEALLRRNRWFESAYLGSQRFIKVGDLAINVEQRTVTRGGDPIELTQREFLVLLTLAKNAGRTLTRHDLLHEIWGNRAKDVYVDAVSKYVRRIREKLELNPLKPRYIRTSHGNGYKLCQPDLPEDDDDPSAVFSIKLEQSR